MNETTDVSKLGPMEVVYLWADQILQGTQGMVAANKVSDFVDSVRWNEPFIRALLLAQMALFAFTYVTRKREAVQFCVLLLLTAITLAAERLNEYGRRNWSRFASQDYFDGPGLFMMVFVSGPFVVLANFIVIGMGLRLVKLYGKRARRQAQVRQRESANLTSAADKKDS